MPRSRLIRWILPASVVALVVACEDLGPNISGVPAYNISSVRVSPTVDTVFITDTIRATDRAFFVAQALGKSSRPISIDAFVWQSSNPGVAIVDTNGVVTPRTVGTTEISASAGKIGRAILVVARATEVLRIIPQADTIFTAATIVPASDTTRLLVSATTPTGTPLIGVAVTWESLTPTVATVDPTGLVHAVTFGSATIRARSAGSQTTASILVRQRP
jgi:uncharacterized protein YjdB